MEGITSILWEVKLLNSPNLPSSTLLIGNNNENNQQCYDVLFHKHFRNSLYYIMYLNNQYLIVCIQNLIYWSGK